MKPVIDVTTGEVTFVERPAEEIDAWENSPPQPPSPEDRIADLEAVIAALLEVE